MPESFRTFIEAVVVCDKALLRKAVDLSLKLSRLFKSPEKETNPDPVIIEQANAMRLVQMGEAVKKLVRQGFLDKNEALTADITPRILIAYRDNYAHPERLAEDRYDFSFLLSQMPQLQRKFAELRERQPENPDIVSCEEAARHFSFNGIVSPTVWIDAANYLQVLRGGYLEQISDQGKDLLDSHTNGLPKRLVKRRDLLCHLYENHGKTCEEPLHIGSDSAIERLETGSNFLAFDNYMKELFGNRGEPTLLKIAFKWMKPDKEGSPQKAYSVGWRLVMQEISRLAKSGAVLKHIELLDAVLEISRRSAPEIRKFVRSSFPEGLPQELADSLRRLDIMAQQDFLMQRKNKTGIFGEVMDKIRESMDPVACYASKPSSPRPPRRKKPCLLAQFAPQ